METVKKLLVGFVKFHYVWLSDMFGQRLAWWIMRGMVFGSLQFLGHCLSDPNHAKDSIVEVFEVLKALILYVYEKTKTAIRATILAYLFFIWLPFSLLIKLVLIYIILLFLFIRYYRLFTKFQLIIHFGLAHYLLYFLYRIHCFTI